jgi:hypothetical protein
MGGRGEAQGAGESLLVPESASTLSAVKGFEDTSGEVDEEEYGEIIECPDSGSKPPMEELHTEGHLKGSSSTSSSLS